ncbi:hypothetical protein Moror_11095 [Moniliophthora roreri MCA 2997]|nr:hypothetical protein Moror_11095 [Moniliophthora roreri MCA 2997]
MPTGHSQRFSGPRLRILISIIGGICTIGAALAAIRSTNPAITVLTVVSGLISIWVALSPFVKLPVRGIAARRAFAGEIRLRPDLEEGLELPPLRPYSPSSPSRPSSISSHGFDSDIQEQTRDSLVATAMSSRTSSPTSPEFHFDMSLSRQTTGLIWLLNHAGVHSMAEGSEVDSNTR